MKKIVKENSQENNGRNNGRNNEEGDGANNACPAPPPCPPDPKIENLESLIDEKLDIIVDKDRIINETQRKNAIKKSKANQISLKLSTISRDIDNYVNENQSRFFTNDDLEFMKQINKKLKVVNDKKKQVLQEIL